MSVAGTAIDAARRLGSASQLWVEEEALLMEWAMEVPDGATIVEIGTAQGGSALLFHRAVAGRGVRIVSYDWEPTAEAAVRLRGSGVRLVERSSLDGASDWRCRNGEPIDLLFIDGGHSLKSVCDDINAWVPLVRPGGMLVLHDYDPPERGGLVHLGVRVAVETLLRTGMLEAPSHRFRLLGARVRDPGAVQLQANMCAETLVQIGCEVVRLQERDYTGWVLLGDPGLAALLRLCLSGLEAATALGREPVQDQDRVPHLMCARPMEPAVNRLRLRGLPPESLALVTNLDACYLLARALRSRREDVLALGTSRATLLRWEETHDMLEHAMGPCGFPERVVDEVTGANLERLSRLVAREHMRLACLGQILETLVGWKP